MEVTKEGVLGELNNIKAALEAKFNEKAEAQGKNLDEKIAEVNKSIEAIQNSKPEVTAEDLKAVKDNLDVTIKALDVVQNRIKSDNYKGFKSTPTSLAEVIVKTMDENKTEIVKDSKNKNAKFAIKAVGDFSVANSLTGNIPNTYRDGLVPAPFELVHARNIFAVTPSATDSYHFYRHTQGEGTIDFQKYEYVSKAQIDEDLTEVTVNLDYLAGFMKISRKMLRNFPALQSYIGRWLPERYYNREDTKAYQTLIAAATGATDTSGTDILSRIIRTIGAQRQAKYNVNAIIVDGNVWAKILTFKASTSGEFTMPMGVVTIAPTGQLVVCGVPVYVTSWVGGDEAIVCDTRYMEIIQSEGLSLQFFDQDDNNVQVNKVTVRIEASVGFAVLDPAAFSVLALESVS